MHSKALQGWTEKNGLLCRECARLILKGQTDFEVKEEKGAISDFGVEKHRLGRRVGTR